ncbi:hypothetical protein NB717_003086 [Xanthomonas sacchari]|nr:hypothetical protein [Xanthomonas sacchari]
MGIRDWRRQKPRRRQEHESRGCFTNPQCPIPNPGPALAKLRAHAKTAAGPVRTHPDHRWGDGHDDPAPWAAGGRLSRRALRRGLRRAGRARARPWLRSCAAGPRPEGQQRPAAVDPAGGHRRDPPRLPRCRRRPARDQYLQRDVDQPGRLPPGTPGLRTQQGRRAGRACLLRRGRSADAGQAAVRDRRARPDQPHRLDQPGRQRPRLPQHQLRRTARHLPRGHRRPDRRRRRYADGRDHLRHAQRQGRAVRDRGSVRRARRAPAGDDLRHHHRRLRPHPVRADRRGVLRLGRARAAAVGGAELRARRQGPAPARGDPGADRRRLRQRSPQRRPAQRLRRI